MRITALVVGLLLPFALSGCGFIALLGGAALLDSEPDKWVQRNLTKSDGTWDVVAVDMRLTSGDVNGELIDEVSVTDGGQILFTNHESQASDIDTWDEREGVWTTPDGPVDIHWDADSNGTEESLVFAVYAHAPIFLWEERDAPYWSSAVVVDDDTLHLELADSWNSHWISGQIELERAE